MKDKKIKFKEWHKFLIKLLISFFQAFLLFFIGLLVSFAIFYFSFHNPILNRVGFTLDPAIYESELQRIGYYDPWFVQLGIYLRNFFTGNWGTSYIVAPNVPVTEILRITISNTIEIILIPLLISLGGFKLGRIWTRKKDKAFGKILTLFVALGVAIPVISLGTMLQQFFGRFTDLPILFRYTPGSEVPNITGLLLLDSIISGNWPLVFDIILHSILPWSILSILITAFVLKQACTRIESDPRKNSIASNSFIAGKMFGFLFLFEIIIEIMFNLRGFGYYFIQSFFVGDTFVINGYLLTSVIIFAFIILFANIIPITIEFIRAKMREKKAQTKTSEVEGTYSEELRNIVNFRLEMKNYIKSSLKNPYTIIGGCLILLLVITSGIYPLLGFYPLNEITLPYLPPGGIPFSPPSPEHPLGTTRFGFDLLARLMYGTQGAFLFGMIVALIGLGGGSIFGALAGKFHRYVYSSVIGVMILFFLFPSFLIVVLVALLSAFNNQTMTVLIGILTIPIFARIIANAIRQEKNYFEIAKSIIKFIPLEVAFAFLLYQALGFIGLSDSSVPQLGETLLLGRASFLAFWATIWPGVFIFFISLSLVFLHQGLQPPASQKTALELR